MGTLAVIGALAGVSAVQEDLAGIDFLLRLSGGPNPIVGSAPTFARTSAAYGEVGGLVVSAESGAPRYLNGIRRGLMIESAHAGNLLLYPRDYSNGFWSKSARLDTAALSNLHLLPDGTIGSGVEMKENTDAGTKYIRCGIGQQVDANTLYFSSVFCKRGDSELNARNAMIAFHGGAEWAGDYTYVWLNFDTGVVSEKFAGSGDPTFSPVAEMGAVEMANGWWLLWALALTGTNTTVPLNQNSHLIMIATDTGVATHTGDGQSSILAWGSQLIKAGGYRSSPLVSQTSAIIPQAADVLSYDGANHKQAYGSLYLDFYVDGVYGATDERMIYSAEAAASSIKAYLDTGGDFVFSIITGGVTRTLTTAQAITAGRHKFAVDFGNESGNTTDVAYLDGVALALTTDTNTTAAPASVDDIYIGQDATGNALQGTVNEVRVKATRQGVAAVRFASGGPIWIPTDAGVSTELWFDASTLELADGAGVTTLADLSGNGRDLTKQAGSAGTPTFTLAGGANGKPGVTFTQTSDMALQNTGFTNVPQPMHFFTVYKPTAWAGSRVIYDINTGALGWGLYQIGTSPGCRVRADSTGPVIPGITVGDFHLVETFHSGAASTAIVDDGTAVTGTVGTSGMDAFTLGDLYALTNAGNSMVFCEQVCYGAELTGADLASLRAYFATKYGVSTN